MNQGGASPQPPRQDDQQLQQPQQPQQPVIPPGHLQPVPLAPTDMNWSYFKPEFSGKPEEDPEAHT